MTIRGLVKKELKRRGYPVEISHYHKGRITWRKYVDTSGIELERKRYSKYTHPEMIGWVEVLSIKCNGYISKEEMEKIVNACLKDYKPYMTETDVYIY